MDVRLPDIDCGESISIWLLLAYIQTTLDRNHFPERYQINLDNINSSKGTRQCLALVIQRQKVYPAQVINRITWVAHLNFLSFGLSLHFSKFHTKNDKSESGHINQQTWGSTVSYFRSAVHLFSLLLMIQPIFPFSICDCLSIASLSRESFTAVQTFIMSSIYKSS